MLSGANAFEVSQRHSAILPLYGASGARASHKVGELTIPRLSSHSPAVASHLAIDHVPLAQAALLKKFGKSDVYDFFAEIDFRHGPILQIIAQLLVRSWDNARFLSESLCAIEKHS